MTQMKRVEGTGKEGDHHVAEFGVAGVPEAVGHGTVRPKDP